MEKSINLKSHSKSRKLGNTVCRDYIRIVFPFIPHETPVSKGKEQKDAIDEEVSNLVGMTKAKDSWLLVWGVFQNWGY